MEQQVVEQHHTPLFEEMHGVGIEDAREAANRLLYPVPTPTDPETRSPGSAPDLGSVEQKAAATVGRWLANGFYARVPASILVAGVTPGAVRLYGVLDLFAMPEFSCYPSRRLLAYILGRSEDAIDDYVSQLEDAGAIAVEPRYTEEGDRTSNLYSLVAGQEAACGRNGGRESPATGPLKNSGTGRRRTSGTVAEVSPTEGQPREGAPSSDARPTMNDTPYVPQGGGEDAQAPNVSEGVPEDVPGDLPDPGDLEREIATSCGLNPLEMTRAGLGKLHRAADDIRAAGGDRDEVRRRANNWTGDYALSPSVLDRNWADLAKPYPRSGAKQGSPGAPHPTGGFPRPVSAVDFMARMRTGIHEDAPPRAGEVVRDRFGSEERS